MIAVSVTVFSFARVESSVECDTYRIRLEQAGEVQEVKMMIFNDEVRVIRRTELDSAIGKELASLVCRQLMSHVDGNKVKFPFTIQQPSTE